jgi:hypothetical protein
MKTMNLKKSLSIHKITRTKCKRNTYRTDELNEKKRGGIKRLKKLTPTRKCTHIGPFTYLWTTGITALQMKRKILKNNNNLRR